MVRHRCCLAVMALACDLVDRRLRLRGCVVDCVVVVCVRLWFGWSAVADRYPPPVRRLQTAHSSKVSARHRLRSSARQALCNVSSRWLRLSVVASGE